MARQKGTPKTGGRAAGTPNKITGLLKDAILRAAEKAGGKGGLDAFLEAQARKENNAPFMALLGKVMPTQLSADGDDIGPPVIFINRFSDPATGLVSATPFVPRDYSKRD
jgi:hypothetical protein